MRRVASCLLALAGCGAALPALPSQGGPAWHQLTSAHFIVWTDAPLDRGRELVQRMEYVRSVIYGVAFQGAPPGGHTLVVALRDIQESRVFVPAFHDAITMSPHNPLHRPMIVMPADAYGDGLLVTHELVHAIAYTAIHDQPRWFAEGLASFFETIDVDIERGTADVGKLRPEIRKALDRHGMFTAASMFACDRLSCTDDFEFYATAWAMYAYLHYKHPEELATFERVLGSKPADQAWAEAFPRLPPEALDHELVGYLLYGGYSIAHFKIEKRAWEISVRDVEPAQVHALRALLWWGFHPTAPEVTREIDAAIAADSTNVLARVMDIYVRDRGSAETARAVAAAHSDDFMAWVLLAATLKHGDEYAAAVKNACALMANDPAIVRLPACKPP